MLKTIGAAVEISLDADSFIRSACNFHVNRAANNRSEKFLFPVDGLWQKLC